MTRAEMRRQAKKNAKKEKTYVLTQAQIDQMKQEIFQDAVDTSFGLMLSIPSDVLGRCYWEKTAPKRIPEFLNECISVYDSIGAGVIKISEIIKDVEEIGNLKMECVERIRKARKLQNEVNSL